MVGTESLVGTNDNSENGAPAMSGKSRRIIEKAAEMLFLFCACISILAVVIICIYIFAGGIPAIAEIGPLNFIFGRQWKPYNVPAQYGIFPMILGSIYVTGGAIAFGVPVGLLTAIFMARFCPAKLYKILKPMINLLAGIPSIVYGLFGMVVIVPMVRKFAGGDGNSIFTASLLLGMMILPTIIGLAETAIESVPEQYYEGAVALGATHERAVSTVVFPAARSGILAGVILGIGRAIGETMAVIMVAGNQARMPKGLFAGVRTMTANIVTEMGDAAGLHYDALVGTAVVLFGFILILNLCFSVLTNKKPKIREEKAK